MMQINVDWKSGHYKFRPATLANINHITVGAITTQPGASTFNAVCLLPGIPKMPNRYTSLASAQAALKERVQLWFSKVQGA